MSLFSSWGPTSELKMAPFVSAPGGNIYSTYPVPLGEYATLSGTSMATPYLTGVAALYLSAKAHVTPIELRNLMITTATPLSFNNGSETIEGLKSPVAQQGGGLVNADRLFTSTTIISPGFIELNVYRFLGLLSYRTPPTFKASTLFLLPTMEQAQLPTVLGV